MTGGVPESHDTLFDGSWLSVRLTPGGYEYVHQLRMGGAAVAVLGYTGDRVLARYEVCPPHGPDTDMCALTGGIDGREAPIDAAVRELYEESGLRCPATRMWGLGTARPSKASDTVMHLFAAPLFPGRGFEAEYAGPGDDSIGELGTYCRFVTHDLAITAKDPLLATMTARLALTQRGNAT